MKTPAPSLPLATLLAAFAFAFAPAASVRAADPPTNAAAAPASATSAAPTTTATPAPQIDPAAMALLKKAQTTMLGLKSYHAQCRTMITYDTVGGKTHAPVYDMATLTALKPNLMRYDSWGMTVDGQGKWTKKREAPVETFVCDGKTYVTQFGATYRTSKNTSPKDMRTILEPWTGFYAPDWSPYGETAYYQKDKSLKEVRLDGKEPVDGVMCDKVYVHYATVYEGETMEYKLTWYIGPDGLVRRNADHIDFGGKGGYTRDATLRDIKTNFPVTDGKTLFAYVPPKGVQSQEDAEKNRPKLLAKGVAAPDFTAVDKDGAAVKLSDLKGKIVVIDFWASWCGPCKASMPHTQEVAKKLQGENVPLVLLAVDDGEEKPDFAKWVKAHPELDAMRFVYSEQKADVSGKAYHVSGIPTQYVIDANGVVRTSFVGYGGPTDDLEKAIRAAATPLK